MSAEVRTGTYSTVGPRSILVVKREQFVPLLIAPGFVDIEVPRRIDQGTARKMWAPKGKRAFCRSLCQSHEACSNRHRLRLHGGLLRTKRPMTSIEISRAEAFAESIAASGFTMCA